MTPLHLRFLWAEVIFAIIMGSVFGLIGAVILYAPAQHFFTAWGH
jgi:hypothetical protein